MRPTPLALKLTAAVLALAALAPRAVCAAQTVPAAEAVLARHEAACGGADALNKHTTIRLTGTIEIAEGDLKGTIEILRGKPNRYVQTMVLNRVGTMIKGFDSTVAWVVDPSGPALLTGPDAQAVEIEANWYHAFLAPPALRIARVDSAEFAGEPAWKLTYASDLGLEVSAFFSRESGLRLGETRATPAGEARTTESGYKDFGGVKFPTTVINRTRAGSMIITIDSVEFDRVAPAALAVPAHVRALMKRHERSHRRS